MSIYELRIAWSVYATVADPDVRETFEAASEDAAQQFMESRARELPPRAGVWLFAEGGEWSIASTSGSAR